MIRIAPDSSTRAPAASAVSIVFLTIGLLMLLVLLWLGRVIFMLLFAATIVAVLLTAIVDWLMSHLHLRRGFAFALILFAAGTAAVLSVWIIGPRVIDQFTDLQTDLPCATNQLVARLKDFCWGNWLMAQWSGYAQPADNIRYALTRIGGFVSSTATILAGLVLVAFLGFYLAAEPDLYLPGIRRAVPQGYRAQVVACGVLVRVSMSPFSTFIRFSTSLGSRIAAEFPTVVILTLVAMTSPNGLMTTNVCTGRKQPRLTASHPAAGSPLH